MLQIGIVLVEHTSVSFGVKFSAVGLGLLQLINLIPLKSLHRLRSSINKSYKVILAKLRVGVQYECISGGYVGKDKFVTSSLQIYGC